MTVKTLRLKAENGEEIRETLTLIENLGIKGDVKAKGGERQLCLCDERSLNDYRADGKGLCVCRFMPNITTEDLDFTALSGGKRFRIGNAEIEISSTLKKCFPDCEFVQNRTTCQIKHACAFAKITEGGEINSGDEIVEL